MTVRRRNNDMIVLEGDCPVEDAELLLQLFQATPRATLDWAACVRLHTAVLQVVFAVRPTCGGPCGDPWVRQWGGFS